MLSTCISRPSFILLFCHRFHNGLCLPVFSKHCCITPLYSFLKMKLSTKLSTFHWHDLPKIIGRPAVNVPSKVEILQKKCGKTKR